MYQRRLTVLLFSGLLLLVPLTVRGEEYTFDYQKTIETGTGIKLDLTYVNGDLQISGNDNDQLVIGAVKRVSAVSEDEARRLQAKIQIQVEQTKDRVTINTDYLRVPDKGRSFWEKVLGRGGSDSFGDVDWVISVPDNCDITIVNVDGEIDINHIRGSLTLRSSASDIALSNIEGPVSIETFSGKTSGELIFGPVKVRQPLGEIALEWIEGDVVVKSSLAKISILQEYGAVDVTTTSGSVTVQTNLDSSRDFFVETESGNIKLLIPESGSGMLDMKSETGEIRSEIPIAIRSLARRQVVGQFGFGGVTISLSSVSGDVTVAQF